MIGHGGLFRAFSFALPIRGKSKNSKKNRVSMTQKLILN